MKCDGGVNCQRPDRGKLQYISGAFWIQFLSMLKETRFFIKSSLVRQVLVEANLRIIGMHSFFKIILFLEITKFSNVLKLSHNLTFKK